MATSIQIEPVFTPDSTTGSSSSTSTTTKRTGRPNGWTESRQRKLARLYLYSTIPTKDISRVLKDEEAKWAPGDVSTTKTVNSLLDKQPRWLRPNNEEDREQRVARLAESRAQRKLRRNHHIPAKPPAIPRPSLLRAPKNSTTPAISASEFSETPLQDIFASQLNSIAEAFPQSAGITIDGHRSSEDGDDISEDTLAAIPVHDDSFTSRSVNISSESRISTIDEEPSKRTSAYLSITSLKKRLSKYSSDQLRDIARLVKVYSISGSSAASTIQAPYTASINSDYESTILEPSSSLRRLGKRDWFFLSGMPEHDAKLCWCLEELHAPDQLWVDRGGFVNEELFQLPDHLPKAALDFRDAFGNTILHMLAARGAGWHLILKALEKGVDGNFKNAAQQTFLHVLPRRIVYRLAEGCTALMALLQALDGFDIKFHVYDIFGRSFYHLLTYGFTKVNKESFWVSFWVLDFLKAQLKPSRDAFGWTAEYDKKYHAKLDSLSSTLDNPEPTFAPMFFGSQYRKLTGQHNSERITTVDFHLAQKFILKTYQDHNPAPMGLFSPVLPGVSIIKQHSDIIRTANIAMSQPHVEDSCGRNGLQCLAEALFPLDKKRKRGKDDTEEPSDAMTLLFNLTQALLGAGVDANHYDAAGNTVLMSFIKHRNDGEDDKILAAIFQSLLSHPYNIANIHRRNRDGESALHVAVRLGRKIATRVLLANGANVHARSSEGKGVLAVGEAHYFRARREPSLYASIHACMALSAGYGAVAKPTLVQEWSMRMEDLYKI